jgi:hypothetical protein
MRSKQNNIWIDTLQRFHDKSTSSKPTHAVKVNQLNVSMQR